MAHRSATLSHLAEIPGETAVHVWRTLPRSEQLTIAGEIGIINAAIHRLPSNCLTFYSFPN